MKLVLSMMFFSFAAFAENSCESDLIASQKKVIDLQEKLANSKRPIVMTRKMAPNSCPQLLSQIMSLSGGDVFVKGSCGEPDSIGNQVLFFSVFSTNN